MIPWVFVILLSIGMTIHIALGLYSRRFKGQSVQLPFEILMYICAIWCATFIFDISSESLALKVLMMQVRFMAVSFIALDLMLIALFFSGHRSWLTTRRLSLLLLIPVITVVLALTTRYSTLFRFNYHLIETSAGFSVLGFTHGPWSSFIYYPYTYILELVTFLLLLQVIFGSQKIYARQALLFFVAILIPVLMDVLFTMGISPVRGYNMVPSTFAFTGVLLAIALFEYRFIDIMPIARTMLIEKMTDPMLVIDPDGRLVDINLAAEQLLGLSHINDTGKNVHGVLAGFHELRSCIEESHSVCSPLTIVQNHGNRLFDITIQEIASGEGGKSAKLILLRDITGQRLAEERAVHLASFPELIPVLILEVDNKGAILYANPAIKGALDELGETDPHIFIPPDIQDRLDGRVIAESLHEVHEIELHSRLFRENVYFTPEFSSLRIYAADITDRKRAEENLRETTEYLRNLVDYASAPIIVWNPGFRITRFNHAFEDLTLMSEQEVIGKPLDILFPEESRDSSLDLIRQTLRGERWESIRIPILSLDGTVHTVLWNSANILDTDGEIISTIAQGIDITKSDAIEQALRESERKYRNLYHFAQVGLFETSFKNATVVACNERYAAMAGFSSVEDAIGKDILHLYVNPDDRKEVARILREQGYINDHIVLLRNQLKGKEFWGQFSARYNYDREVAEGSIIDITGQMKTLEALKINEEKYRILFTQMTVGNILHELILDPSGNPVDYRVLEANPAFERITGIRPEDAVGKTSVEVYGVDSPPFLDTYARVATTGISESFEVYFAPMKKHFAISAYSPEPGKFATIVEDITERKQIEETLKQSEHAKSELSEKLNEAQQIGMIGSWEWDLLANKVWWSDETYRIFGVSQQDFVPGFEENGRFIHPEDFVLYSKSFGHSLKTGEPLDVDLRLIAGDGSLKYCHARGQVTNDNSGRPVRFIGTLMDITERKRTEAELEAVQQRYRELFESVSIGILRSTPGPEGALIEANPAALTIFEADTREQLLAVLPRDLYADHEQRRRISEEILATGFIRSLDVRYKTLKGNLIWGRITSIKKISSDGQVYFDNTIQDITQQKKAEADLATSEQKFSLAFKTAPYAITITRVRDGTFIEVNDAFTPVTGYSHEEAVTNLSIGLDLWVHQEDRRQVISKLLEGGNVIGEEFLFRRKDGGIITALFSAQVITLKNEPCILSSINDISERKQAEEALRESNDYLNNLFNYANAPIITWDQEFRITRFNHAFEHLAGRSQEEVLGKNLEILFPAGSKETSLAQISKTLEGERWEAVEIPILNADGSIRSVLWNSANVLNRDGKIVATIAQGVDITEQNKALDRIRWLASFPELNPNPVIEMGATGEILFANAVTHTVLRELGLSDDPLLFIPGDLGDILYLLTETEEPHIYREITLAGQTFSESIALNRALQVARIYTTNITEVKRAERERERMLADLEQKNAELERFAYTASHDLKTPLITIRGFLGFVERDAEVGDMVRMRQDILRISNATVRMQELLDSLLELSRIGRIVGPPEPVSMRELSGVAAELLAVPIQERGVTLRIAPDLPEVYGDKKRLLEVMTNLLENAVKFMGDQPAPLIEIGVRYDGEKPAFFIRDNGIGIPHEYQSRLFTLFERIEVSVPGTGVGLALVKRIIEIHGGKIQVESEGAGKGTTFWFTLPGVPENWDNHEVEKV